MPWRTGGKQTTFGEPVISFFLVLKQGFLIISLDVLCTPGQLVREHKANSPVSASHLAVRGLRFSSMYHKSQSFMWVLRIKNRCHECIAMSRSHLPNFYCTLRYLTLQHRVNWDSTAILLPQPAECWHFRFMPPCLTWIFFFPFECFAYMNVFCTICIQCLRSPEESTGITDGCWVSSNASI